MRVWNCCGVAGLGLATLSLGACLIYPYNDIHHAGVPRLGAGTNITEQVMCSETGAGFWMLLSPEGPNGTARAPLRYRYYLRDGTRSKLRFLKGDSFKYLTLRPVTGTNLWVWFEMRTNGVEVSVFNAKGIVRQRLLPNPLGLWQYSHCELDAGGQHLTYSTTNGFERYDVLHDTVALVATLPDGRPDESVPPNRQ